MIPATTTIAHHHPHGTIIQQQQQQQTQIHASTIEQVQQQQQHGQELHEIAPAVHSIVTTATANTLPQTINLLGLRNVQITEQPAKNTSAHISRIKYSRGKIITTQGSGTTTANVQIIESQDASSSQSATSTHDLSEGGKYEISDIDLHNPQSSAAIISDLVKYAEIDDIELPDGTKIGIGFAASDMSEQQIQTAPAQITVEHHMQQHHMQQQQLEEHHQHQHQHQHQQEQQQHHHHHQQHHELHECKSELQLQDDSTTATLSTHHQELQLQEHDEATTSVEETLLPDGITVHEQPLTKSYTILTTRPLKHELSGNNSMTGGGVGDGGDSNTTTYELSLSDSSLQNEDTKYICRHCGKKYRWKSTLRRHENVECGGKEPCHPCPYCSYKAKQRGNLGVHVRKHHPDKPQLESKRGRKTI